MNNFEFSKNSLEKLDTVHPDLRRVVELALERTPDDFAVICGHRGKAAQEKAFADGFSKVQYPNSKHNSKPSLAVDLAPLTSGKIDWGATGLFIGLSYTMKSAAEELGIDIVWGGDWESLRDFPHYELKS